MHITFFQIYPVFCYKSQTSLNSEITNYNLEYFFAIYQITIFFPYLPFRKKIECKKNLIIQFISYQAKKVHIDICYIVIIYNYK